MTTFNLYNTAGEKVGTVKRPEIFQVTVDAQLIHRYFVWVRTMLRPSTAHTKVRGDVSGGGKKPWKQKGTGRARIGSTRAPHWRHGGVAFGPTPAQNWQTRMPRAERRKAFMSALSAKAEANQVIVLDEWKMEAPKTKAVISILDAVKPLQNQKVLHLATEFDRTLFASTNNLPHVSSKTIQAFNLIDVLNADCLLITKDSLEALTAHFTTSV